jgi:hypothetical protein
MDHEMDPGREIESDGPGPGARELDGPGPGARELDGPGPGVPLPRVSKGQVGAGAGKRRKERERQRAKELGGAG